MLTELRILNTRVTAYPFSTNLDASLDPVLIKNIDGLGPVKADISTTKYGSVDGEFYNDSQVGNRNIILTVGLNPDWESQSIEEIRQVMYTYFMPKTPLTLRFSSTHMAQVAIHGYVESFEPNMFTKIPEYQVSIICPNPYFTASNPTIETGNTIALTDDGFLEIDYQGTADCGFVLDVEYSGKSLSGELRVYNEAPDLDIFIMATAVIDATHSFRLSTIPGDKYAQSILQPAGVGTNVLSKVLAGSQWFPLKQGINHFRVLSSVVGLDWTLTYSARYGGL